MFKRKLKNKQEELNKEIAEVLAVMEQIRPQPYEDGQTILETEIKAVLDSMKNVEPDSEEYTKTVNNLEKLYKMRDLETTKFDMYTKMAENLERLHKMKEEKTEKIQIPWKEITVGVLGCVQIYMIIRHEEINVFTGKALGFVSKGRV